MAPFSWHGVDERCIEHHTQNLVIINGLFIHNRPSGCLQTFFVVTNVLKYSITVVASNNVQSISYR